MAKINPPKAPNLPLAPNTYERQYGDQVNNALRLYFNRLDNAIGLIVGNEGGQYLSFPYGAFQDNTNQTAAAIDTPYAVILGTTDYSNSVRVVTDGTHLTRITVDETGIYNMAFSLQFQKTSSNAKNVWVWPRVNGVDVPDSATKLTLQGSSAAAVAAWNFFLNLTANDYVQLMWAVNDTDIVILHESATGFCPEIPSAILTMNFVSAPPVASTGA